LDELENRIALLRREQDDLERDVQREQAELARLLERLALDVTVR
jgi:hypothetical protein